MCDEVLVEGSQEDEEELYPDPYAIEEQEDPYEENISEQSQERRLNKIRKINKSNN